MKRKSLRPTDQRTPLERGETRAIKAFEGHLMPRRQVLERILHHRDDAVAMGTRPGDRFPETARDRQAVLLLRARNIAWERKRVEKSRSVKAA